MVSPLSIVHFFTAPVRDRHRGEGFRFRGWILFEFKIIALGSVLHPVEMAGLSTWNAFGLGVMSKSFPFPPIGASRTIRVSVCSLAPLTHVIMMSQTFTLSEFSPRISRMDLRTVIPN
jgi:hypothetical protein